MEFRLLFPSFRPKAVTFSYDDGVLQDVNTVGILNNYHLKGTFNLNSGQSGLSKIRNGIDCSHLNLKDNVLLFDGHEIATHTYLHPHLEEMNYEEQMAQYKTDIENLQKIFGRKIYGSAYPYGTYNAQTVEVLKDLKIEYARTVQSTYSFHRPYDFLLWHPTIHHNDPLLKMTLDRFYQTDEELAIFYLWGHSYEFALDNNFRILEDFCSNISAHEEIWPATNHEIFEYISNAKMVYFKSGFFINPSLGTVWLKVRNDQLCLKPLERVSYAE